MVLRNGQRDDRVWQQRRRRAPGGRGVAGSLRCAWLRERGGSFDEAVGGVGYRNNKTKGVATGDQPEGIYLVASGRHDNQWCCFDYGNAETNNKDNGPGTMETLYFGTSTQWGRGSGSGPWVMAHLEDGVFAGGSFAAPPTNTSLSVTFVTAMLGGKAGSFRLKGGDGQSSSRDVSPRAIRVTRPRAPCKPTSSRPATGARSRDSRFHAQRKAGWRAR